MGLNETRLAKKEDTRRAGNDRIRIFRFSVRVDQLASLQVKEIILQRLNDPGRLGAGVLEHGRLLRRLEE